jgi:hypothetical protein
MKKRNFIILIILDIFLIILSLNYFVSVLMGFSFDTIDTSNAHNAKETLMLIQKYKNITSFKLVFCLVFTFALIIGLLWLFTNIRKAKKT